MKSEKSFIKVSKDCGASGFVLFMSYIGAVVYFFNQSPDFGGFILALIKAIAWPAFVIDKLLVFLGA